MYSVTKAKSEYNCQDFYYSSGKRQAGGYNK